MPPWLTPSWSTCACWTLTLSPPPHATLASSAPLVGLLSQTEKKLYFYTNISKYTFCWERNNVCAVVGLITGVFWTEGIAQVIFQLYFQENWIICLFLFNRASLSFCGYAEGDDQVWNEHCSLELLPWHTRGEYFHSSFYCVNEQSRYS